MHNHERGAAHVPVMFFLLLLVMFLGALVFGYVMQTKNGELLKERADLRAELKALKDKDLLVEHYVDDVGRVIGKPGKYEGRESHKGMYEAAALTYPNLMNPVEVKKLLDDSCQRVELPPASGLENVLGSLLTRIEQQKARIRDIESERDKAQTDRAEIDKKFQTATTEASAKAREFAQNLEQTNSNFAAANADKDATLTRTQESLRQKNDELTAEKERATAREKFLANEVAKHQMQNSALVARDALIKPPDVPDGKILVARNGIPKAFINLGKKDMLVNGTVFRVKNVNGADVKGIATVTKVEEDRSEVALSSFKDPIGDYAREGDLLYNELYTPGVTRTIYLMGRFTEPYAKDALTNLLKRLGNRVVSKMQPGVDTVILGNDPVNEASDGFASVQDSDEFKLASELRVEFIYLTTIRDLVKL